jgi:hypothetical protein
MSALAHLSTLVGQTLLFLGLPGVVLFALKVFVLGDHQIAAAPRFRKRFVPTHPFTDGSAGRVSQSRLNRSRPSESGGEKRRSLRRNGNPVTVLISDALIPGKPLRGLVLDRSRGGLYLSVPHRIDAGCLLTVRTLDFPDSVASVRLLVRHCKENGKEWRIGCQFVEKLPWSVLLLFG